MIFVACKKIRKMKQGMGSNKSGKNCEGMNKEVKMEKEMQFFNSLRERMDERVGGKRRISLMNEVIAKLRKNKVASLIALKEKCINARGKQIENVIRQEKDGQMTGKRG